MAKKPIDQFQAEHLQKGEEIRQEIYRKMSFEQKLDIFFDMYRAAWKLKYEWLKKQHPDWTHEQVDAKTDEIFFYARS